MDWAFTEMLFSSTLSNCVWNGKRALSTRIKGNSTELWSEPPGYLVPVIPVCMHIIQLRDSDLRPYWSQSRLEDQAVPGVSIRINVK